MTRQLHPVATITIDGVAYAVSDARLELDESWSPYARATLTAPYDDPAAVIAIDPRAGDRATITAAVEGHWNTTVTPPVWVPEMSRTFNLGIRSRDVDFRNRTAAVELASDEALLQDYATLTEDKSNLNRQTSLRSIVNYMLGMVSPGAALVAGPDADMTVRWNATNLVLNPRADATTNYNVTQVTSFGVGNTAPYVGSGYLGGLAAIVGDVYVGPVLSSKTVRPGQTVRMSARVRSLVAGRRARGHLAFRDAAGNVMATTYGPYVNLGTGSTFAAWTLVEWSVLAPANAATVDVWVANESKAVGDHFEWDAFSATVDSPVLPVPYFDGDTPDTSEYTYAWSGPANSSASTRTAAAPAAPESLVWSPGTTAWDFLDPLLSRAGLRLFCDEARVWRMVAPTYGLPTVVALVPANSTEAVDTITREASSPWADGAVVRYLWDDPEMGAQVKVDTAGVPGKVLVVEYRRPYPGPGAAGNMLMAMQRRGRVQDITALTDYATTPGMESHIPLSSGFLAGRVRAVTFDLSTGLMEVASKDQSELVAGMIDALLGTIDALPGTIDAL